MLVDIVWWVAAFCLNMGATRIATHRAKSLPANAPPLPDVLLELLPVMADWAPDVFIFLTMAVDVFLPAGSAYYGGGELDTSALKRFINVSSSVMFIRALTTWVTSFPSPLLTESSLGYGQHDLMFSGHTSMMFAAAASPLGYGLASFGAITVLCARQHYTVDVIVAIVISVLVKSL